MRQNILKKIFVITMATAVSASATALFAGCAEKEPAPVSLQVSTGGNPIGGFGVGDNPFDRTWTASDSRDKVWQKGDEDHSDVITYGGDPAVMVTEENGVETAYLYVGHDISQGSSYIMPEWLCYSSTDLIDWKAEGVILDIEDVPYANAAYDSAWASQVVEYKGYYWFLFCTYTNPAVLPGENGQQCIGLAVSDDPAGPFECYDTPLIYSSWTNRTDNGVSMNDAGWNDIDPTAWVTSEGKMYVAWGNTNAFLCRVEMVESYGNGTDYNVELEVVDCDESADGETVVTDYPSFYSYGTAEIEKIADIMRIDLSSSNTANNAFTEAPYLYARDTDNDGAEDRYYMFYAAGWREALAYSYVDADNPDGLWEDIWTYGNRLMDPSATSNTNHPAVFDFGGKTYMIYHNGSLPYGCGYRRAACIVELEFSENGFVNFVCEYSVGVGGSVTRITQNDIPVGHLYTVNSHDDAYYPMTLPVFYKEAERFENGWEDALWELMSAKYVPEGENAENYVSVQAYNMAGLYLAYDLETGKVTITQDHVQDGTEASDALQERMSFKTIAIEGKGVMFRCAADPAYYLAVVNGELVVSDSASRDQTLFRVQTATATGRYTSSTSFAYNEG